MGHILYAKPLTESLLKKFKSCAEDIFSKHNFYPTLAVIIVGENSSSLSYVRQIAKTCKEALVNCEIIKMPEATSNEELKSKLIELSKNKHINGIIVQSDLPKHIDKNIIPDFLHKDKDVDSITAHNVGLLSLGKKEGFRPCTPLAALKLLKEAVPNLEGKSVAIIGRSNIVGKPMFNLLLMENATVTVCHSKTKNLKEVLLNSEIIIAALGKAKFLTSDMVSNNAVVIDVGINFDENNKLCGDVDFENVKEKVSAITPVPGGVGPLTNIMLIENTLTATLKQIEKFKTEELKYEANSSL